MMKTLALVLFGLMASTHVAPLVPAAMAQTVANQKTVTFKVDNMTCALCPVTVKRAMRGVNGVRAVEIDFGARTATVVFDSAVTSAEAISAASRDAGYPAVVRD